MTQEFVKAARAAAFGDPDDVFGPKVPVADPAPVPAPPRVKQTEMRPLAEIQAQLRAETERGLQGGRVRRGKLV